MTVRLLSQRAKFVQNNSLLLSNPSTAGTSSNQQPSKQSSLENTGELRQEARNDNLTCNNSNGRFVGSPSIDNNHSKTTITLRHAQSASAGSGSSGSSIDGKSTGRGSSGARRRNGGDFKKKDEADKEFHFCQNKPSAGETFGETNLDPQKGKSSNHFKQTQNISMSLQFCCFHSADKRDKKLPLSSSYSHECRQHDIVDREDFDRVLGREKTLPLQYLPANKAKSTTQRNPQQNKHSTYKTSTNFHSNPSGQLKSSTSCNIMLSSGLDSTKQASADLVSGSKSGNKTQRKMLTEQEPKKHCCRSKTCLLNSSNRDLLNGELDKDTRYIDEDESGLSVVKIDETKGSPTDSLAKETWRRNRCYMSSNERACCCCRRCCARCNLLNESQETTSARDITTKQSSVLTSELRHRHRGTQLSDYCCKKSRVLNSYFTGLNSKSKCGPKEEQQQTRELGSPDPNTNQITEQALYRAVENVSSDTRHARLDLSPISCFESDFHTLTSDSSTTFNQNFLQKQQQQQQQLFEKGLSSREGSNSPMISASACKRIDSSGNLDLEADKMTVNVSQDNSKGNKYKVSTRENVTGIQSEDITTHSDFTNVEALSTSAILSIVGIATKEALLSRNR